MLRRIALLLLIGILAQAATTRLYLKDGTWHNVREYQKLQDRVRYYSTERGEWEEIPLELEDLERSRKESEEKEATARKNAAEMDAEEKAERAQRREVERIPMGTGVFWLEGEMVNVLKQAETKVVNNRRRSILKAMSPIPIVAGKSTVELEGTRAPFSIASARPEFYIRLASEERFHIVRLSPLKASRLVQTWNVVPVTKEIVEDTNIVETFRQQLSEGLFKIWPTKPVEPGEYAVVEFTEGKGNIQVWDVTITPPGK